MSYCLNLHPGDIVPVPRKDVDRLLHAGDANAALLYLTLAAAGHSMEASEIRAVLKWDLNTLEQATVALERSGLIGAREPLPLDLPPERPRTDPTRRDVMAAIESDSVFSSLRQAVGEQLNRLLTEKDDVILLGLYSDLGIPADVIYVLVSHCIRRAELRYGEGHRPTMRQVEQEGYRWKRLGLMTQEDAAQYLRDWGRKQEQMPAMMAALQLGSRAPVGRECEFLERWIDWGFSADAVAYAYEKTIFKCGKMEWKYANGILKDLNKKGLHTMSEIETGDRMEPPKTKSFPAPSDRRQEKERDRAAALRESDAWMDAYLRKIKNE